MAIVLGRILWPISDLSWAKNAVGTSKIFSMSKLDVENRLGPPDNPDGSFSGWDYVYYLEPDWLGIDNWWLIVNVDDEGQVVLARVVSD